jgi:hypothetical protein
VACLVRRKRADPPAPATDLAFTHTRLSGSVLLTVEGLEALLGNAVTEQAGRQLAYRDWRAAVHA